MRNLLLALLCISVIGCTNPLGPSRLYTCTTQPRGYASADGTRAWLEVDTYTQAMPCPRIPIQ